MPPETVRRFGQYGYPVWEGSPGSPSALLKAGSPQEEGRSGIFSISSPSWTSLYTRPSSMSKSTMPRSKFYRRVCRALKQSVAPRLPWRMLAAVGFVRLGLVMPFRATSTFLPLQSDHPRIAMDVNVTPASAGRCLCHPNPRNCWTWGSDVHMVAFSFSSRVSITSKVPFATDMANPANTYRNLSLNISWVRVCALS